MPGEVLARFRENKRGEAPVNCTLCLQWLGMDEHTSFVEAEVNGEGMKFAADPPILSLFIRSSCCVPLSPYCAVIWGWTES